MGRVGIVKSYFIYPRKFVWSITLGSFYILALKILQFTPGHSLAIFILYFEMCFVNEFIINILNAIKTMSGPS